MIKSDKILVGIAVSVAALFVWNHYRVKNELLKKKQ